MQKGIATIALATGATVLAITLFGGKKAETESTSEKSTESTESTIAKATSNQSTEPVIMASTESTVTEIASEEVSQDSSQPTESAAEAGNKEPSQSSVEVTSEATAGEATPVVEATPEIASKEPSQPMSAAHGESNSMDSSKPVSGLASTDLAPAPEGPFHGQEGLAGKPSAPTSPEQPEMSEKNGSTASGMSAEAPSAPTAPTAPSELTADAPVAATSGVTDPVPLAPGVVSMGMNPEEAVADQSATPQGKANVDGMDAAAPAKPEAPAAMTKPESMVAPSQGNAGAAANPNQPAVTGGNSGQIQMPQMNLPSTGFQMPQMNMPAMNMNKPMGGGQGAPRIIYVPVPVYSQQPVMPANIQPQPVTTTPEAPKQPLGQ